MLNQLQGRLGRRYIALIIFALLAIAVWHRFGSLAPSPVILPNSSNGKTDVVTPVGTGSGSGGSRPGSSADSAGSGGASSTGSGSKSSSGDDIKYIPSSYDWSKAKVYYPVENMKSLPSGTPKAMPKIQAASKLLVSDEISKARKQKIKEKLIKSWDAYKTHAWTKDELMPLSGKGKQSLNGWAAQLVDALDSLWLMGLKDEFHTAIKEVAVIDWAKTPDPKINLFEVTIRYLGGLISAYDLSQEKAALDKAVELGDALYATFDTPNRLPSHWLYYEKAKNGEQVADTSMSGAAGGSLCMEFTRLSQITGDPKYYDATERIKQFFYRFQDKTKMPGLWPHDMNYREETMIENHYTIGAGADSLYEYLPKMHALLGGLDPEYEEMTVKALETARDNLLFRPRTPNNDNILLSGNAGLPKNGKVVDFTPVMQHLTCFAGGMYALAGKLLGRDDFLDLGSRLTGGCVWLYDAFPTNIMPENAEMIPCETLEGPCEPSPPGRSANLPDGIVRVRDSRYMLRPEAIESVFYMWRITGDQKWRDAAWRMWQGIVKECETELAFATLQDVKVHASSKADSMEVS